MERSVTAHRQLRGVMWFSEVSIIIIAALTSVQIALETGGNPWACGPVALIAIMEAIRVPLAGWAAHLKPVAMIGAFIVMAAISVLTFEGMSVAVERFMHQRVVEVEKARKALDVAEQKQDDEAAAEKLYQTKFDKLTAEAAARRDTVVKLQAEQPTAAPVPPSTKTCTGQKRGGKGVIVQYTYRCPDPTAQEVVGSNSHAQKAHDDAVRKAQDAVAEVESEIKALPQPVHAKETENAVADAKKALDEAASESTFYRTAATWFGTSAKDLTSGQFETFKRYAVFGVAGAMAVITMLVSFISHAVPRERTGKLARAIRAYLARRRKNVVRIKTVEKPVEKIVEKSVGVPGPEKIVVKHIHVPVDLATNRVVNRDGSLGEEIGLRAVQGGRS